MRKKILKALARVSRHLYTSHDILVGAIADMTDEEIQEIKQMFGDDADMILQPGDDVEIESALNCILEEHDATHFLKTREPTKKELARRARRLRLTM